MAEMTKFISWEGNKEDFLKQPLATGMEYVWDIVHKQHQECIMSNMGEHKRGDLF